MLIFLLSIDNNIFFEHSYASNSQIIIFHLPGARCKVVDGRTFQNPIIEQKSLFISSDI